MSGQLLGVGLKTSIDLKYEYKKEESTEEGEEQSVSINYAVTTTLKPGQKVYCRAYAMMGQYDGKFHATVCLALASDVSFIESLLIPIGKSYPQRWHQIQFQRRRNHDPSPVERF